MAANSITEPLCLQHFLEALKIQSYSMDTADAAMQSTEKTAPVAARRRQPSRGAKKPTNFYEIENPSFGKRGRDEFEEDLDQTDCPLPERRRALKSSNYDIDLDEVDEADRAVEIIWAAKRLMSQAGQSRCCLSQQVVVCRICELLNLKSNEPPQKKRRIKLVGRLAPPADMESTTVSLTPVPEWKVKGAQRPFMIVKLQGHHFAVDLCKTLMFMPMSSAGAGARVNGRLFGSCKC